MLTDIIIWLVVTLGLTAIIERTAFLFTDFSRYRNKRLFFYFAHPFLLTFFALLVFNSSEFYSSEADLSSQINAASDSRDKIEAAAYLDSNFVLIDNATARRAIAVPGTRSTTDATDRAYLSRLLADLHRNREILDLVVLDMVFPDPDPAHDAELQKQLNLLSGDGKLVLGDRKDSSRVSSTLPDSIFGRPTDKGTDNKYSYHQIRREGKNSLSYLIYHRIDGAEPLFNLAGILLERRPGLGTSFHLNAFLPDLAYLGEPEPVTDTSGFSESDQKRSWKLEDVGAELQSADLVSDLRQRKKNGLRNVVFIGDFSGQRDVHLTSAGPMAGPVILYNICYDLHMDEHRLSWWAVLAWYTACLVLTILSVWDALLSGRLDLAEQLLPDSLHRGLKGLSLEHFSRSHHYGKRFLGYLGSLLTENAYLVFLVLVLLLLKRFTGVFINGLWLLYYIVIFKKALSYFTARRDGAA